MELLVFALYTAFCGWAVFMDGAEVLEGWKSWFLFGWFAAMLTAEQLRFYIGVSWLASLAILLFHLFGGAA